MKKLLLVACLGVAALVTTVAEAGCWSGNCNRSERTVRAKRVRTGRRSCGTARCNVACKPCESKEYVEPAQETCYTEEYCRMVSPEKTIVVPAKYEKVTCTKRISDCCVVKTNACTAEEAAQARPIEEAPAEFRQKAAKVQATK